MSQRVNQQQLDLFNQNFNIQLLEKDIELTEYNQLTKEHFETNEFEKLEFNDYFGAYPIADEYVYSIVKKEKPFGKPIKIIQHTRDIKDFILQEMDKTLQTKPVSIKELDFEEKLKLFNQHFKFGVIQETRYYRGSPDLTSLDLELGSSIQGSIDFVDYNDAYYKTRDLTYGICKNGDVIKKVNTKNELKHFIENDMENYL